MKKFVLAAAALALSAGAALADNPYVGKPDAMAAQEKSFAQPNAGPVVGRGVDFTAPASIHQGPSDGSAHRFGDASPSSYGE